MPYHRESAHQREQISTLAEAQGRGIPDGRMEHDYTENEKGVLGMNVTDKRLQKIIEYHDLDPNNWSRVNGKCKAKAMSVLWRTIIRTT